MIFVIDDSGGLLVFGSEIDLRREIEESDVVNGGFLFFGEDGQALVVQQDPEKVRVGWRKFIFGPNTEYVLRAAKVSEGKPDLAASQANVRYVERNPHFETIAEAIEFTRRRREAAV
jgi:hypothetical protein